MFYFVLSSISQQCLRIYFAPSSLPLPQKKKLCRIPEAIQGVHLRAYFDPWGGERTWTNVAGKTSKVKYTGQTYCKKPW